MGVYIIGMLYLYKKKQSQISKKFQKLQNEQEKEILSAQLEMHEQTLNEISKEIHDNISLSLTLAKLNLNTLELSDRAYSEKKIANSIELISRSILELNDLSKSLNSEIIINHGILKALEYEMDRIENTGLFKLNFEVKGVPVYADAKKELIIFRIIQESFNNIIKHSYAKKVSLTLEYFQNQICVTIEDNGKGFNPKKITDKTKSGLNNISGRVSILEGNFFIRSEIDQGTQIRFSIPIK